MATVVKLATSTRRWLAKEGEENEQDERGDLCGAYVLSGLLSLTMGHEYATN